MQFVYSTAPADWARWTRVWMQSLQECRSQSHTSYFIMSLETDVGDMTVNLSAINPYYFCLVTDSSWAVIWQNGIRHKSTVFASRKISTTDIHQCLWTPNNGSDHSKAVDIEFSQLATAMWVTSWTVTHKKGRSSWSDHLFELIRWKMDEENNIFLTTTPLAASVGAEYFFTSAVCRFLFILVRSAKSHVLAM